MLTTLHSWLNMLTNRVLGSTDCSSKLISTTSPTYLFNEAILVDCVLRGQWHCELFGWSLHGGQDAMEGAGLLTQRAAQYLPDHGVKLDPSWIITAGTHWPHQAKHEDSLERTNACISSGPWQQLWKKQQSLVTVKEEFYLSTSIYGNSF